MKNREKYAKEIMDIACAGESIAFDKKANKVTECNNTHCSNCAFFSFSESCLDKIKEWCESEYKEPEVDWNKVEIDTPILVRDSEDEDWYRRYFAEYKDGDVCAWDVGRTSWSADGVNTWEYAKLAESEEE